MDVAKSYCMVPEGTLFFRDARPMDVNKAEADMRNVGHGAYWPRPDLFYSAVIHLLTRDPLCPETQCFKKIRDLAVMGPYPYRNQTLYLPMPLDWDMALQAMPEGATNLPAPLTAAFLDRKEGKKTLPQWISTKDYLRYLVGKDRDQLPSIPTPALYHTEVRVGTTLDVNTGASRRIQDAHRSGQYQAEYLRLAPDVSLLGEVRAPAYETVLNSATLRFGGQGGCVTCVPSTVSLLEEVRKLQAESARQTPTRYVRWTLIAPALFMYGWYPNWLNAEGKVMFPQQRVERRVDESREAYRQRATAENSYFATAHLIAARVGNATVFSGFDSVTHEKPTELAVPQGASYVFECADVEEAQQLMTALSLERRSDLGEKGFGIGLCSYVTLETALV